MELAGVLRTMVVKRPWKGPLKPLNFIDSLTAAATEVYGAAGKYLLSVARPTAVAHFWGDTASLRQGSGAALVPVFAFRAVKCKSVKPVHSATERCSRRQRFCSV